MKFNERDVKQALAQLGMVEFFPPDPATRGAIGILLAKICPHREALDWLVAEMVNHVGKWHGSAELRGLLCTHYKPSDEVEENCSLPGYTPRDAEEKHLAAHQQLKAGGTLPPDSRDLLPPTRQWPPLPLGKPS